MNGYRVSFCGMLPSLLPSGDSRQTYLRHCATREEAEALFESPSAYRMDRRDPETGEWVMLCVRDRQP
jgi:hypothetical protein